MSDSSEPTNGSFLTVAKKLICSRDSCVSPRDHHAECTRAPKNNKMLSVCIHNDAMRNIAWNGLSGMAYNFLGVTTKQQSVIHPSERPVLGVPNMEAYSGKLNEEQMQMRRVAFFAIVISTAAVISSIVTLPMLYSFVHSFQSHLMVEADFCKVVFRHFKKNSGYLWSSGCS